MHVTGQSGRTEVSESFGPVVHMGRISDHIRTSPSAGQVNNQIAPQAARVRQKLSLVDQLQGLNSEDGRGNASAWERLTLVAWRETAPRCGGLFGRNMYES